MKIQAVALILNLVTALSGCASNTNAVIESLRYAVQTDSAVARAKLNPNLRYLRATVDGRIVLLVLGYVEPASGGPIEVWYSAQGEVLRLQNGRVVGAVGLTTEWHTVLLPKFPRWSTLVDGNHIFHWVRIRDVMPGYRFGVRDRLTLRVVAPPSRSALQNMDPLGLVWFEEAFEPEDGSVATNQNSLPPSRYAIVYGAQTETVVYGEQCLASRLCFSWQRWPAMTQDAKETP